MTLQFIYMFAVSGCLTMANLIFSTYDKIIKKKNTNFPLYSFMITSLILAYEPTYMPVCTCICLCISTEKNSETL